MYCNRDRYKIALTILTINTLINNKERQSDNTVNIWPE